jgi:hypothetical protein
MREMIKLPDGTWTANASSPPVEVNVDLPDNIKIENVTEDKPRRKARERKGKS